MIKNMEDGENESCSGIDSSEFESQKDDNENDDEENCLHDVWRSTPEARKFLKDKLGKWKRGRWTPQDVKTLKENVQKYLKSKGVKTVEDLKDRGKSAGFYRFIAKGINRPLFSVYRKASREYDEDAFVGRWTETMMTSLLKEQCRRGNQWKHIGRVLGVRAQAARDKYIKLAGRPHTGPWQLQEVERLVSAVTELNEASESRSQSEVSISAVSGSVVSIPGSSVSGSAVSGSSVSGSAVSIPGSSVSGSAVSGSVVSGSVVSGSAVSGTWYQVADLVVTRNAPQCRVKWLFHLEWKERGGVKLWAASDDRHLLEALLDLVGGNEVEDEDDVDWAELYDGWESARSSYFLRSKWASLRRQVPRYSLNSFQENLSYLEQHLLPALQHATNTSEPIDSPSTCRTD